MASLGKKLHNEKRLQMAIQSAEKRAKLKELRANPELSLEEYLNIQAKLGRNRNASFTRYRKRCIISGRPRGQTFAGLSRIALRDLASQGKLPGIRKASW